MKIETIYTLIQPLSHIGESESTSSFLNTIRVVNNGKPEEVFAYSGNAIRGSWRDCGAVYLLESLGIKAGKKMFGILFSGGNISGEQKNDIDQAREIRETIPLISILGAGIGNQILSGKITQGFALPVCRETVGILPDEITEKYQGTDTSWKQMTGTIQFSRKDDEKDQNLKKYKADEQQNEDESPTQMRYEVEYFCPGTRLYHVANLDTTSKIEEGAFVSCIAQWSKNSVLGGMSGKGFGLVDAVIKKDGEPYLTIQGNEI